MISRKFIAAAVAGAVLLLSFPATASPRRIVTQAQCTTAAGSVFDIAPMSIVLTEIDYDAIDLKITTTENRLTRAIAENQSLRKSPDRSVTGWLLSGAAVSIGILLGRLVL